jgi:hypothetical protein
MSMRLARVLALVLLGGCGQQAPMRLPAGELLSPDPYRPQIVAIDKIVFQSRPVIGSAQLSWVTLAVNQLADRIDSASPSPLTQVLNRNLRRLGQVPPRNVPVLQREWLRIRSGLFTDAAWFRRSAADPVASAEDDATSGSISGASDQKQLENAMHHLVILVFNVRANPRDTADAPRWNAKLDAIANEMPAAPDADPPYATAYQRTRDALQLARQMRLDESYAYMDTAFKQLKSLK